MSQTEPTASEQTSADAPLGRAERAFASGDHAALRRALPELLGSPVADTRSRAELLARRLRPDQLHVVLLLLCALGFAVVFIHYVLR